MSTVRTKAEDLQPISKEALRRIEKINDEDIDYSDIPALNPDDWKNAVRGKFYRPRKEAISIRIDCDVLHWLRSQGDGYQSRINSILRAAMLAQDAAERKIP